MNARKLRTGTVTLGTLGAVWLAASSCSVLYNLNTNQCDKDIDCAAKGSQFDGSICRNHVCVAQSASTSGGASSTGGQSSTDATGGDTSATTGGASSTGGDTSTGGTGTTATTTAPACVNADCIAAHVDPWTCINGVCTQLLTTDCPVLLPQDTAGDYSAMKLLSKPAPIIVGGFASMSNAQNPYDTQAVANWNLAFTEFNSKTSGGLQSYDGSGVARPLIGLICNGNNATTDTVDAAMAHLTQDVRVPAVLSTLSVTNLLEAYNFTTRQSYTVDHNGQPVFFMNTGSANLQLMTTNDNGLIWSLLGNPRLLAASAAALVRQIEPVVKADRQAYFTNNPGTAKDDPSADNSLRVTLVYSDNSTMSDVHDVLLSDSDHPETLMWINGKLVTDPANSTYFNQAQVVANSSTVTAATTAIQNNKPHIIVAMGTSEFPQYVLQTVENSWGTIAPGQMRPYYVMSNLIFNGSQLRTALKNMSSNGFQTENRIVGVGYAQINDSRSVGLYNAYYLNLVNSYGSGALVGQLGSTENYYDGAYYLLYSIAAAEVNRKPSNPISGTNIFSGLTGKVINPGASYVDVGPGNIATVLNQLQTIGSGYSMALWGLDGPPNFDTSNGTRAFPTSAWCIIPDSTVNPPFSYVSDGLLYDPKTKTFTAPSTGVPNCLKPYQ